MIAELRRWSPLPLRLFVGLGFIGHAVPRLFTVTGHLGLASALHQLGVAFSGPAAWFLSTLEFLSGLAVLEGVLFPVATGLLLLDVLAALAVTSLRGDLSLLGLLSAGASGPALGLPGAQANLLYAAALLSLLLGGPGAMSVSDLSRSRARPATPVPAASAPPRMVHA